MNLADVPCHYCYFSIALSFFFLRSIKLCVIQTHNNLKSKFFAVSRLQAAGLLRGIPLHVGFLMSIFFVVVFQSVVQVLIYTFLMQWVHDIQHYQAKQKSWLGLPDRYSLFFPYGNGFGKSRWQPLPHIAHFSWSLVNDQLLY